MATDQPGLAGFDEGSSLWRKRAAEGGHSPGPLDSLAARLVEDMVYAWERGDRPPAEVFLARHPGLAEHSEAAIRLIYEEVCLRRGAGQEVRPSELVGRFPQWRTELEVLLDCDRLLEGGPETPVFPVEGETLGDFLLLSDLGRGARGRCFLATQPSLAGRQVVLKVTPDGHGEHLALARLQHTHIVPLYSEQELPDRGLRVLCMPDLGGATLGQVLEALRGVSLDRRTGLSLVGVLDRARGADPTGQRRTSPARQFLARATYVQAVCWVGACLADALQYAHDRGLLHMDVKPSNILLAADGQPMLLDFHLAHEPWRPGDPPPDWLGGTHGYMSPEQQAAVAALRTGRTVSEGVDARSDLYSLGVVLCEALAGAIPAGRGASAPGPHELGLYVSRGLRDLIVKCLSSDPCGRYPDAASLAADLRRHMADQPLRGVANHSWTERWHKWCRRRPDALIRIKALFIGACVAGAVSAAIWIAFLAPRFREAERSLLVGKSLMTERAYAGALRVLTRGAALIEGLPFDPGLSQELAAQLQRANRVREVDRLHSLVERLRSLESAAPPPPGAVSAVERQCRAFWELRHPIGEQLEAGTDPETRQRLRNDLLDLAVIWAGLHVRLATNGEEVTESRREALEVLDEAEAMFGPSHVLYRERHAHAKALGLSGVAEAAARDAARVSPQSAWEHAAVGRSLLASGDSEGAEAAFERSLALRPQDFWPNYYQGVCAFRRGRYEQAVNAFRVCVALAPDRAECFYNRALCHTALGRSAQAASDYERATKLDPALTPPPFGFGRANPENAKAR